MQKVGLRYFLGLRFLCRHRKAFLCSVKATWKVPKVQRHAAVYPWRLIAAAPFVSGSLDWPCEAAVDSAKGRAKDLALATGQQYLVVRRHWAKSPAVDGDFNATAVADTIMAQRVNRRNDRQIQRQRGGGFGPVA
jgi:hypothetical protein